MSPQQSRFQRELVPKQGREFHVDPTAGPPLCEGMLPPGPAFSLLCISTALTVPLPNLHGGGLGGQWGKAWGPEAKGSGWLAVSLVGWLPLSLTAYHNKLKMNAKIQLDEFITFIITCTLNYMLK